jgi:hypothetical protein
MQKLPAAGVIEIADRHCFFSGRELKSAFHRDRRRLDFLYENKLGAEVLSVWLHDHPVCRVRDAH